MRKLLFLLFPLALWAQNPSPIQSTGVAPSGACGSSNVRLLVPNGTIYTCQNGTWAPVSSGGGGGTVTQIDTSAPIAGGPITTTGTISCPTCVVGPASVTSGHIATFNGTTGKLIQDGGAVPTGTVTSVGLLGTTNQITVTGSTPITTSGSWTLSLPSTLVLPNGTTATTQSAADNSTKVATTAYVDNAGGSFVPTTRTVSTTAPLGGGGALSSNLTLTCSTCATSSPTNHGVALGSATQALGFTTAGSSGQCLISGGASADPSFTACPGGGLVVGTTAITSGSTTKVLFDNAGVLGEYTISGSVNVCMTTSCVMTTPNLGTPSAATLTNATGLPLSGLSVSPAFSDTYANIVAATCNSSNEGRVGYATNNPYHALCKSSAWSWFMDPIGPITPPGVCSDYGTGFNNGANWTCTDTTGVISVDQVTNATTQIRGVYKSTPSTPWTKTMCSTVAMPQSNGSNANQWGMFITDGTKAVFVGITLLSAGTGTFWQAQAQHFTNATTPVAASGSSGVVEVAPPGGSYGCFQIADDGSVLTYKWLRDGVTPLTLFTENVGTFITPTGYGFGGVNHGSGNDLYASIVSYN